MPDSCKNYAGSLSSLVKKYLMAISGLVLASFAFVHMIGNLQMFQSPEHINVYAHFLQHLPPPALWGFRAVMLACVLVHAATGILLALENRAARGFEQYAVKKSRAATLFAKTMPYTGLVLLAFIAFHIAHFTVKAPASLGTGAFHAEIAADVHSKLFGVFDYPIFKGETVNDCYNMVVTGFGSPVIGGFYILAMFLVALHLSHGIASAFQTFGLRNEKWRALLDFVAFAYGTVLFLGLAAVPAAVFTGRIGPEYDAEGKAIFTHTQPREGKGKESPRKHNIDPAAPARPEPPPAPVPAVPAK
ncbi:MAG: succinate dehydrogenase cytochrome b subunit [Puniceicoccales bacterium]|jgi:succinate dehydrogenase / fumarate reductase cytochrome b subunit|nr:succinate dehydrogenase cytochrome b subunit [Puniceicoccales bacterium]